MSGTECAVTLHRAIVPALGVTAGTVELAGWWARVGAQILDQLVVAIGAVVLGVIAGVAVGSADAGLGVGVAAYFLDMLGYYTALHGSESGQTLGKRAASIAVRDANSAGRASYGKAFARIFVMMVFQLISLVQVLNFLWPLWDPRNQALHDKIAGTIVVRV
jgi:uncharacterized RDD family membrane protein YckC